MTGKKYNHQPESGKKDKLDNVNDKKVWEKRIDDVLCVTGKKKNGQPMYVWKVTKDERAYIYNKINVDDKIVWELLGDMCDCEKRLMLYVTGKKKHGQPVWRIKF